MAIAPNTVNDRLPGKGPEKHPTDTAKQNYMRLVGVMIKDLLGWVTFISKVM